MPEASPKVLRAVAWAGAMTVATRAPFQCWAAVSMMHRVHPAETPLTFIETELARYVGYTNAERLALRCMNPMDASLRWSPEAVADAERFIRTGWRLPRDPAWATRCRNAVVAYLTDRIDLYEAQRSVAAAHDGGDDDA